MATPYQPEERQNDHHKHAHPKKSLLMEMVRSEKCGVCTFCDDNVRYILQTHHGGSWNGSRIYYPCCTTNMFTCHLPKGEHKSFIAICGETIANKIMYRACAGNAKLTCTNFFQPNCYAFLGSKG